jgi:hypothetical protein
MTSIPIALNQLETITEMVARDLLEEWAINDRFTEDQLVQATQNAVSDTIFVMNRFMTLFNEQMMQEAINKNIIN